LKRSLALWLFIFSSLALAGADSSSELMISALAAGVNHQVKMSYPRQRQRANGEADFGNNTDCQIHIDLAAYRTS
jgi:hypothetical protein